MQEEKIKNNKADILSKEILLGIKGISKEVTTCMYVDETVMVSRNAAEINKNAKRLRSLIIAVLGFLQFIVQFILNFAGTSFCVMVVLSLPVEHL